MLNDSATAPCGRLHLCLAEKWSEEDHRGRWARSWANQGELLSDAPRRVSQRGHGIEDLLVGEVRRRPQPQHVAAVVDRDATLA